MSEDALPLDAASAGRPATAVAVATRDERLETMVERHFDVVWRSLRRLGVSDSGLDDAAQQVFIVAARKVETIEEGGEKAYLLGIAVRVASDARRSTARRREVGGGIEEDAPDPLPPPDELVDQKRARQMLDGVLASMPMDLRAAFTLFEIEGMTVPEVAAALDVPVGTAASRLRRARELFHDLVRRLGQPRGGNRV
jgi:RNA polymerase sigma-70 factor (ECF subfamily)